VHFYLPWHSFDYLGEIVPHYMDNTKLKSLGFEFKYSLREMLESAVQCCVDKGLIPYPG
jgi:nucleoside-diphosphate-sugar epimerase